MWQSRKCSRCGMVAPGAFGICRSCGAISGRWRLAAVALLAASAVASVAAWVIVVVRPFEEGAPTSPSVLATCDGWQVSADAKGTDTRGTIQNVGSVAVDVSVIVRGIDSSDRVIVERTFGPFRDVPAGGTRPIRAYLDSTPFKYVTYEVVRVGSATEAGP